MNSGYLHAQNPTLIDPAVPAMGFADFTGIIETTYATVRIVKRYPNAVKVQVQTNRYGGDLFRTPFACLDAFIAFRNAATNEVIGGSMIVTSAANGCYGTGTVFLNSNPRSVIVELYRSGTTEWLRSETTLEMVKAGNAELVDRSGPIRLNDAKIDDGGFIESPQKNTSFFENPAFEDVRGIMKWGGLAIAAGAGVYFLAPFAPVVKSGMENISGKLKKAVNG